MNDDNVQVPAYQPPYEVLQGDDGRFGISIEDWFALRMEALNDDKGVVFNFRWDFADMDGARDVMGPLDVLPETLAQAEPWGIDRFWLTLAEPKQGGQEVFHSFYIYTLLWANIHTSIEGEAFVSFTFLNQSGEWSQGIALSIKPERIALWRSLVDALTSRNNRIPGGKPPILSSVASPSSVSDDSLPLLSASGLNIYTGQETTELFGAVSNGKRNRNYKTDEQLDLFFYERPGATHRVQLFPDADYDLSAYQTLAAQQDLDGVFVLSSIITRLAPFDLELAPEKNCAWVDLDELAERAGLLTGKRGIQEDEAVRLRVYNFIRFGQRAQIIGARSIEYYPKRSGREGKAIPTFISHPLWTADATKWPGKPNDGLAPLSMRLTMTPEVVPLFSNPDLAQFMQGGERIAAIAGGKPSGAWARSMGLALMLEWRQYMREAVNGTLLITRRKLLETFPPKIAPVTEVFNSSDPGHAKTFWSGALQELANEGVVHRKGEASTGAKPGEGPEHKGPDGSTLPRQGWQKAWLDTEVRLYPGSLFHDNLTKLLANKYDATPRNLATLGRKRGRPRKDAVA